MQLYFIDKKIWRSYPRLPTPYTLPSIHSLSTQKNAGELLLKPLSLLSSRVCFVLCMKTQGKRSTVCCFWKKNGSSPFFTIFLPKRLQLKNREDSEKERGITRRLSFEKKSLFVVIKECWNIVPKGENSENDVNFFQGSLSSSKKNRKY